MKAVFVVCLGFDYKGSSVVASVADDSSEAWDEIHDAKIFDSFWKAVWQAVRHLAWVEEVEIWEG